MFLVSKLKKKERKNQAFESHSKNFPDSLTWGDIYSILKPMKLFLCYFLFVVEHVTDHNRTILWRECIERIKWRNKGKENYAFIY